MVEPIGYDRAQAARLAAGADRVLEEMKVERTLDDALGDCVDVIMTSGRGGPEALTPRETAQRLLAAPGPVALVFGDEVRGLTNAQLARAAAVATIPTTEKSSINLAQSVLIFAYELMLAQHDAPPVPQQEAPLAGERILSKLRERAQSLLLDAGFLNPQQPEAILDELLKLLRRTSPTRREAELLLAAVDQLKRRVRQ